MKKKLEADLISIAHRVLQMKNRSDINQLYIETKELYEKLTVLQFIEEHFEGAKPTIGQAEVSEKINRIFEETSSPEIKTAPIQEKIVVEEIIEEKIVAEEISTSAVVEEKIIAETLEIKEEKITIMTPPNLELNDFEIQPSFGLDNEEEGLTEKKQVSFHDLLGEDYSNALFVKVDELEEKPSKDAFDTASEIVFEKTVAATENIDPKSLSLNDKLSKKINIGLNDRIAFVKHLFGNSDEDYSRVLNQIITYDSFDEAQDFIEEMVKPDYNSWKGKEDYSQRFIEIIEKKFA